MAYIGFNKLKEKLAKSGAKNPGAVVTKIGMEKYGKKAMENHAKSGTSMEHTKPLKKK